MKLRDKFNYVYNLYLKKSEYLGKRKRWCKKYPEAYNNLKIYKQELNNILCDIIIKEKLLYKTEWIIEPFGNFLGIYKFRSNDKKLETLYNLPNPDYRFNKANFINYNNISLDWFKFTPLEFEITYYNYIGNEYKFVTTFLKRNKAILITDSLPSKISEMKRHMTDLNKVIKQFEKYNNVRQILK